MDIRDGFIAAVEEKMQADGVTRKELAERCGYAEVTIDRILDKNITLRLDTAVTIAAEMGLSIDATCGIITRRAKILLEEDAQEPEE